MILKDVSASQDGAMELCSYLHKNSKRLVGTIFRAQPSGTFRKSPNENHLEEWHRSLHSDGNLPSSIVGILDSAEHSPRSDDGPHIPQGVVHGGKCSSMLRVGEFHDQ
jgi:hypothetical protein